MSSATRWAWSLGKRAALPCALGAPTACVGDPHRLPPDHVAPDTFPSTLPTQPEFWPTSVGGYEPGSSQFVPGFDAYSRYFSRVATALNPCTPEGPKPKLAGPGWGNVNTIDAAWLATQAKAPGMRCYMRELSVHVRRERREGGAGGG